MPESIFETFRLDEKKLTSTILPHLVTKWYQVFTYSPSKSMPIPSNAQEQGFLPGFIAVATEKFLLSFASLVSSLHCDTVWYI